MRNRLSGAVLVVACMVMLSGCEGFNVLLDLFPETNLAAPEREPAEQASGVSHEVTEDVEEAETTVGEILDDGRPPEDLDDLRAVRPADAKIATYLTALAYLDGNRGLSRQANLDAHRLHNAALAGHSGDDVGRLWRQQTLDVISDVLISTEPPGPEFDPTACADDRFDASEDCRYHEMASTYCTELDNYAADYGQTIVGDLYLRLANPHDC